jgi:hypothetical protein
MLCPLVTQAFKVINIFNQLMTFGKLKKVTRYIPRILIEWASVSVSVYSFAKFTTKISNMRGYQGQEPGRKIQLKIICRKFIIIIIII